MLQDHAVAIVSDESLWDILPEIHKAGLGHLARVIRLSKRGTIVIQLQRAGVPVSQAPPTMHDAEVILLVPAAARSERTAQLAIANGASAAWIVTALGAWNPVDDTLVPTPESRPTRETPLVVPGRGTPAAVPAPAAESESVTPL